MLKRFLRVSNDVCLLTKFYFGKYGCFRENIIIYTNAYSVVSYNGLINIFKMS